MACGTLMAYTVAMDQQRRKAPHAGRGVSVANTTAGAQSTTERWTSTRITKRPGTPMQEIPRKVSVISRERAGRIVERKNPT